MAGVFTIRPKNGSNVVCSLGDVPGVAYVVVDADFADQDRENIVYSEKEAGGKTLDVQHHTAEARFTMAILGSSASDVAAKVRTINQAFGWRLGGTIQFKPIDYPNNVLHTYYHFLKSGPSTKLSGKGADSHGNFSYGEMHEFRVRIMGWATSNPDDLVGISTTSPLVNNPHNNTNVITLSSSLFKGDIVFPTFAVFGAGDGVMLYLKTGGSADNGNAADHHTSGLSGVTELAGGTYVGGDYYQTNAATGYIVFDPGSIDDNIPVSASPLIRVMVPAGSTFDFRVKSKVDDYSGGYSANFIETGDWVTVVGDGTARVYVLPAMGHPPIPSPGVLDDAATLDSRWLEDLGYELEFSRTVGSGNAEIDMLCMARIDPWAAEFTKPTNGESLSANNHLFFDSFDDLHGFYYWGNPPDYYRLRDIWVKNGSQIGSLFFNSSENQHISVLAFRDTAREHVIADTLTVNISGLWGTIRPFEVS